MRRYISIHAPHTGRDRPNCHCRHQQRPISIHAPHTGRDGVALGQNLELVLFQSTRPIRGATLMGENGCILPKFQSTRPIRGATPRLRQRRQTRISISIHAPHTGRDTCIDFRCQRLAEFQSTRPIRGATHNGVYDVRFQPHFNPRAPYGARHIAADAGPALILFQSTRPIRGATVKYIAGEFDRYIFQSTRPIRGAT